MEILIATRQGRKLRELKELLRETGHIEVLSLLGMPEYTSPTLDGLILQSASILLAEHAAQTTGMWVLADMSGIVVPALSKTPYNTASLPFEEDVQETVHPQKLLGLMAQLSGFQRAAYLECCLSLASPSGLVKSSTAICEGMISLEERGHNGFAYDSLFVKYDYDKTFSELECSTKNRISHRRKAFDKILPALNSALPTAAS
jgi:XTP/dITP diphosphohydrolase